MPLPLWSKSNSHFVAFFLKSKLLTEAIAVKGTCKSWNDVKKFKIPKNKPKKPELSNPSTTATYTIAMSNIHSSAASESKQEESTESDVINALPTAAPTSTPESSIDFDVGIASCVIKCKTEDSESDTLKLKQTKLSSYFAKKWILLFFIFIV